MLQVDYLLVCIMGNAGTSIKRLLVSESVR